VKLLSFKFLLPALMLFLCASFRVLANPCEGPGIGHIQRPYFPDQPNSSESFQYTYLNARTAQPDSLTVIVLTGGPGMTTIGASYPYADKYPQNFGVILIDPRGVGCNEPLWGNYPMDFFSTKYLAMDVLSVVEHLNLENYALHGMSYGTMVATVAAGLAETTMTHKPRAVILEGTLGRAFEPMEVFSGFISQWNNIRQSLPNDIQFALSNITLPLNFSGAEWGNWISSQMVFNVDAPSFLSLVL
jgi:pimeloyl-ACP methyl ester carboxylesterase